MSGGRSARQSLRVTLDYYAERVDRLKQLREPAAIIALVGLALHFALTLAYLVLVSTSDGVLLADLAFSLMNPVPVALLAVLVATCWVADATPRAKGLTVVGLILTAVLLVTITGLLVASVVWAAVDVGAGMFTVFLGTVPWLTTAVIALGVFVALLRRPSVAASPAVTAELVPSEPVPAPPVDPQLQPGWSPDAAVGTVWRRAGDAAAGAPATSWDSPGQTAGWWGPASAMDTPSYVAPDQPTAGQTPSMPPAERPARRGDWSSPSPS